MRVHFPSLAIGALVASVVFLLAGAQRPPMTMGRFHLETNENHVFVLDRDTGRVWQKFLSPNSGHTDPNFDREKTQKPH